MGIVLPAAYALVLADDDTSNNPVVGFENLATVDTVVADHEVAEYPATNLGNPATNLVWKSGSTADQYLEVRFGEEVEVSYIALARHNLGSGVIPVTVQGLPFGGDPDVDGDWDEVVEQVVLANDRPVLWRFAPQMLTGLRLKLEPDAVAPQAAVLYCGKLLVFEKGVQAGHTPIPYGRQRTRVTSRSQAGEHLGTIISGGRLVSSASIIKLTAAWYRSTLDPFFEVCAERPFFWAWQPGTYPDEVGFCTMANDPVPVPDLSGYIDVQLSLEGLIL